MIIKILTVDEEIVSINLPKNIKVEILNADAVVKGQTASSSFKNAETTRNLKLLVPSHIKVGDKILINSENLEYVEKAKN
jgi:elongation factor P